MKAESNFTPGEFKTVTFSMYIHMSKEYKIA